ncbi:CMRF35-like molecule 1 [Trichomycterus rosablanca]|uniref:CMRF35-like molecule 1 n=1 Tax=Trichomycterus rosablanca TaxID=2290929 RepID=UPI002F351E08
MKSLLVFTFCLISAGTAADIYVTGFIGGSVEIRCPYEAGDEENMKYLCRGNCHVMNFRDIPVQSGSPPKDRRFSLYDTRYSIFIITITDLRLDDTGTYWCGVQRTGHDLFTKVQLRVTTAHPKKTTTTCTSVPETTETTPTSTGHDQSTSHPPTQQYCLAN